jgi:hypothetical protein
MTDEQFNALRTLIKDQTVEIKALALTIRKLEERIVAIEALFIDTGPDIYSSSELIPVLRMSPPREPRSDSE